MLQSGSDLDWNENLLIEKAETEHTSEKTEEESVKIVDQPKKTKFDAKRYKETLEKIKAGLGKTQTFDTIQDKNL